MDIDHINFKHCFFPASGLEVDHDLLSERLMFLTVRIRLRLNPKEEDHQKLMSTMMAATKKVLSGWNAGGPRENFAVHEELEAMVTLSQPILKREWDRVRKGD